MSDLSLDVNFEGSGIEVDAEFGYSNTRYVSPSEYTGELSVVPSHERHILETTGKMLNGNVTVEAAPVDTLEVTENGTYFPSEGKVGFSKVTADVHPKILYELDLTESLTEKVLNGLSNVYVQRKNSDYDYPTITPIGIEFTGATQLLNLGDLNLIGKTIEIDIVSMDFRGDESYHVRLLTNGNFNDGRGKGFLIYRSGFGWSLFDGGWAPAWFLDPADNVDYNIFSGKTVALKFIDARTIELYLDGLLINTQRRSKDIDQWELCIGGCKSYAENAGDQCYNMIISAIRIKNNE